MAALTPEPQSALPTDDVPLALTQLSALVDEELEEREIHLLLRRLIEDHAARDRWEDYCLIGDVLRSPEPTPLDVAFASRVQSAIAAEPVLASAGRGRLRSVAWRKPAVGLAVAASLALLVWVGWQPPSSTSTSPQIASGSARPVANASETARVAALPTQADTVLMAYRPEELSGRVDGGITKADAVLASYQPEESGRATQQNHRLKKYLVNHSGYASRSMPGILPYARMADYQVDR